MVKSVKKHWGVFAITETVLLTGTLAAVLALAPSFPMLSVIAGASGVIGAAAYWAHFRSLGYSSDERRIIIRKGVLVRSVREIPTESILMLQSAELMGRILYTSLYTVGGKAVLFCEVDIPDISRKKDKK